MDKKTLDALETILIVLIKLNILTKGKNAEYYYDRLQMNILLYLIDDL